MELKVVRNHLTDNTTMGELYINGELFCFTLEDKTRDVKVWGETCIPLGRYKLEMLYWPKHKGWYPHVCAVPQFSGIMIHKGNSKKDTEGCLLVGMTQGVDYVSNSGKAFDPLRNKISDAIKAGEEVWIEYVQSEDAEDDRSTTT